MPLRIWHGQTRILQPEHMDLILAYVKDNTEAALQELVCVVTKYEEGKVSAAARVAEKLMYDQNDEEQLTGDKEEDEWLQMNKMNNLLKQVEHQEVREQETLVMVVLVMMKSQK